MPKWPIAPPSKRCVAGSNPAADCACVLDGTIRRRCRRALGLGPCGQFGAALDGGWQQHRPAQQFKPDISQTS